MANIATFSIRPLSQGDIPKLPNAQLYDLSFHETLPIPLIYCAYLDRQCVGFFSFCAQLRASEGDQNYLQLYTISVVDVIEERDAVFGRILREVIGISRQCKAAGVRVILGSHHARTIAIFEEAGFVRTEAFKGDPDKKMYAPFRLTNPPSAS